MLSAVIPVFNEAESLPQLFDELGAVARSHGYDMEMIFVDDGSTDGSWNAIRGLAARDSRARGIRFRRNFGKAAALQAGFQTARGEIVVTLDADLQDDPREIPAFLAALAGSAPPDPSAPQTARWEPAGAAPLDVVSGWKKIRRDPWHKVGPSRVFNWLVSRMTGVKLHDHNCGMKCYRREALAEVRLYGELHRFIPVLAAARGFRVGELAIQHRPRRFGRSKYGLIRFVRGFLDLLTVKFLVGFGHRPQHLLGAVGLAFFTIGALGLIYLAGYWVVRQMRPDLDLPPLHERPAMLYALGALVVGSQFFSIGLLAELIAARHGREEDVYSIAERIGSEAQDEASPHERSPTRQ